MNVAFDGGRPMWRSVAETGEHALAAVGLDGSQAAVEAVELTKRYGDVIAVDHLTFRIREGAVTGFLGPNGAGKTTTLRMVLGLARPTSGYATVYGRPYRELEDPPRTVGANLEISGRIRAARAATTCGRWRRWPACRDRESRRSSARRPRRAADRPAGKYSQGMRQRLGLATTLLGDPHLLVLDEPANGLDPQGIRWLRDFLRGMAREGRTVLVSSHVLAEVAQTVDDVVVIHRGRLVEQGPVDRLTTGGGVLVRTPEPDLLRASLEREGIIVTERSDGALIAHTDDPARVGQLAYSARVPVHELQPRATSLEEAFLALTSEAPAEPAEVRMTAAGARLQAPPERRGSGRLIRLLSGELIKVRTTRTALGFGLAAVAIVLVGVLVSFLAGDPRTVVDKRIAIAFGSGVSIVLLLFGAVGATGEFRHHTLAPALLIAPDRLRLLAARVAAYTLTALLFGVAMLVVGLAVGIPLLENEPGPDLATADYVKVGAGGLIATALAAALGVGYGTLVRNQVLAVIAALVWFFILENLLHEVSADVHDYSIGTALTRLAQGGDPRLSMLDAGLVSLAWTALFCAAATIVDARRDID